MARYSSPEHSLPASWWEELKRFLRLRPDPPEDGGRDGLGALFVRRREVRPREIATCYLRSLDHVTHIADRLRGAQPVVLNLEDAEGDSERVLDFISGVAYALDGSYERIGDRVFLFVPGNVDIIDEE